MRIGILSRNHNLYSTRRLVDAARQRGHIVHLLDTLSVAVELQPDSQQMRLLRATPIGLAHMSRLPELDAIIPRIGASITFYGVAVVRQFEALGVLSTAVSDGILASRDKLHSLQIMQQAGLPVPRTAVIAKPQALFTAVESVGGLPAVIKLVRGTQGKGVILVHDLTTAARALQSVEGTERHALLQEFITEADGRDLRVIVVGNRCVAAMQRISADGEFRSNLHMGGTAAAIKPDRKTQKLAVAAAQAHGLAVAGVDLIQAERGALVLEVNSSPGLEGIEGITGIDVAAEIVAFLERNFRSKHPR